MDVIFLGTGTSQGVPMIACDCAVCTSTDMRNHRTRASIHVVMDGLHIQVDAAPEFRLQCLREGVTWVDGERIHSRRLSDGDEIRLGAHLLRFELG